MKVAVCFSGYPMFIKQHKKFWLEIIDKYQADVYASLWSGKNSKYLSQDEDTVESFKHTYKPTSIEVEDPQVLNKSFKLLGEEYAANPEPHTAHSAEQAELDYISFFSGQIYSMAYKIWRANLLCVSAEKEYDVVVRAETCSSYPNMKIVQENNISIPSYFVRHQWSSWGSHPSYKQCGLWQHLAFGPPHLMTYFSSLIFYLRKYFDESIVFPSEALCNYHLSRRPNIEIRLFSNEIKRKMVHHCDGGTSLETRLFSGNLSEHPYPMTPSLKELNLNEGSIHKMHSNILFRSQANAK